MFGVFAVVWAAAASRVLVEGLVIDVRDDIVIDVLTDVMVDVDVDMSGDVGMIIVVATVVIALEFAVPVPYAVGVVAVVISCGVFDIFGVDILADVSVFFLAAVTTALTFVTAPSEEAMPCS